MDKAENNRKFGRFDCSAAVANYVESDLKHTANAIDVEFAAIEYLF